MAFVPVIFAAIGHAVAAAGVALAAGASAGLTAIGLGGLATGAFVGITSAFTAIGTTVAALGGAAGLGAALSAWSTVAGIASLALGSPQIGAGGSPLDMRGDPYAGAPYVLGRTATAGNLVFAQTSADPKNTYLHYFGVLSAAGPSEGIESFKAGDDTCTFTGGTYAVSGTRYAGHMWMATQLGAVPSSALPMPAGTGPFPDWTPDHKLSGYTAFRWVLKANPEVYATGTPEGLFVVLGPSVYDPREDSTQPGGSGSQRWDDETTWSFVGNRNPYLQAITWCIGRKLNGKRLLGIGAPIEAIDVPAFIEGANVCDANGWEVGGVISSKDSKNEVLKAILQAGGGMPLQLAARISCVVQAPRVAIATITAEDLVGPASRAKRQPRRDRVNQVLPRYRSEAHKWEVVTGAPVKVQAYIDADRLIQRQVDYPLVQDVTQASQLAAYGIYDVHEFSPVTLPLRPRWMGLKPGDVISAVIPGLMIEQDLLILERRQDPATMAFTITCRSENPDKHEEALGLTGLAPDAPVVTGPSPYDIPAPGSTAWSATGGTETEGTVSLPFITIAGAVDHAGAEAIILEYRRVGDTEWRSLGDHPRSMTSYRVASSLLPGVGYEVAVSYRIRGVPGARRVLPVVTTGIFTPGEPSTGGGSGGSGGSLADGVVELDTYAPGPGTHYAVADGFLDIELWGAGGTPGNLSLGSLEGGGGGYVKLNSHPVTAGDAIAYVVGAPEWSGLGGGGDGGDTQVSSLGLIAGGGAGFGIGTGGSATGGDVNTAGTDGGDGIGGGAGNGGGDQTSPNADGTFPGGGATSINGIGAPGRVKITYRTS